MTVKTVLTAMVLVRLRMTSKSRRRYGTQTLMSNEAPARR